MASHLFTSESVSEGHPDKVCDRISDTVVDLYLAADAGSRVGCETLCTTNLVVIAGEVRGPESIGSKDVEDGAREAIRDIGYEQDGFHWERAAVQVHLHKQSGDIAQGVDASGNKDEGAGDQGLMFGYACRETPALMPAPIHYSHRILMRLSEVRRAGEVAGLGPDSKSQVTLRYENGKPVEATSVVVSTQHDESLDQAQVRELVRPYVEEVLPDGWMCPEEEFYVNPTGRFVIGGPDGDCGLTGRKIIGRHLRRLGPPTAEARSPARTPPRWTARPPTPPAISRRTSSPPAWPSAARSRSPTPSGCRSRCPSTVDTGGTGRADESKLSDVLRELVDLSPRGIRERLGLSRPIYGRTSAYGHFGREPDADGGFSWERTDLVPDLKSAFGA